MPELALFGEVGTDITAKKVVADLKTFGRRDVTVRLDSAGGSVTEGIAVYNALINHPAKIHVSIEGSALNMGSVVAMAGDTVSIAENALVMIHRPWTGTTGTADDLRSTADVMDKMQHSLVAAYVKKTGKTEEEIIATMTAEIWFDATEALAFGLVDEITEPLQIAASFDITRFSNVPEHIKARIQDMTTQTTSPESIAAAALAADTKRRTAITASFSNYADEHPKLLNDCLSDTACSVSAANAKLLVAMGKGRTSFGGGVNIRTGGDDLNEFKAAATDALLAREGIRVEKPHAAARDLSRMSIVGMAETFLKQRGTSTRNMSATAILNAVTHSTGDFLALLSNVAGKALIAGYDAEPASHRIWTKEVEVPDFKTQTRVQLSEAPALLPVLQGDEYTHGTFGDAKEEYQLITAGRLFSITRQALINDDMSAFTRLPQAFGASATRREADEVYGILTTNGNMSDGTALFHADHSNLMAAAALSIASLGAARAAMRIQTGLNGQATLNLVPRYLVVPAALETVAEQLLASLVDPSKSNSTPNLDFVRGLTLVVDARLDADSTTAWYLAADSMQVDTIERAYLEGQRGVSYEERPGWEVDGMEIKARLDFASKAIDWRGLLMNPGA